MKLPPRYTLPAVLAISLLTLSACGGSNDVASGDATRLQIIQAPQSVSTVRVTEPDNVASLTLAPYATQVMTEALLAGSLFADVAIQNAGGVRIAMPAGTLSMNTAFALLRFTNVRVELHATGQQLVQVLEDAVANHRTRARPAVHVPMRPACAGTWT